MDCDEVEQSVLYHETLCHSTFVANHLSQSFGNSSASELGYLRPVFVFDEDHKPHLPHADELHIDEIDAGQILF